MSINNSHATSETSIQLLIDHAITQVPKLNSGEKFMARDLFLGYEWNRLTNYVRAQVGSGFYHQYAKEDASEVTILEKTARNQQLYRKN